MTIFVHMSKQTSADNESFQSVLYGHVCVCMIVCVGEVIIHGFVKYSDSCVSM